MLGRDYSSEALRRGLWEGIAIDLLTLKDETIGFAAWGPAACASHARTAQTLSGAIIPRTRLTDQSSSGTSWPHAAAAASSASTLQVNKHNRRAIEAYERAGFAREASILDDIGEGFFMDDYVLAIQLGEASLN
ncbi:MAG: hypothetical protein U5O39_16270 [Gammaproteobacteria bacterium]|nr:hypothetical protein [Gammaproteobacteria bacterium]